MEVTVLHFEAVNPQTAKMLLERAVGIEPATEGKALSVAESR